MPFARKAFNYLKIGHSLNAKKNTKTILTTGPNINRNNTPG